MRMQDRPLPLLLPLEPSPVATPRGDANEGEEEKEAKTSEADETPGSGLNSDVRDKGMAGLGRCSVLRSIPKLYNMFRRGHRPFWRLNTQRYVQYRYCIDDSHAKKRVGGPFRVLDSDNFVDHQGSVVRTQTMNLDELYWYGPWVVE